MNRITAAGELNANNADLIATYSKLEMLVNDEDTLKCTIIERELIPGTSISAINTEVQVKTVAQRKRVTKCKLDIAALEQFRDHLRFVIKHSLLEE